MVTIFLVVFVSFHSFWLHFEAHPAVVPVPVATAANPTVSQKDKKLAKKEFFW